MIIFNVYTLDWILRDTFLNYYGWQYGRYYMYLLVELKPVKEMNDIIIFDFIDIICMKAEDYSICSKISLWSI